MAGRDESVVPLELSPLPSAARRQAKAQQEWLQVLCTWEQLTELVWPWLMSLRPEFVDVDVDRSRTTVVNVPAELRVVLEAHLTAHRLVLAGPVPHGGLRPWVIMPVDAPRGALWPQPFTNANLRTTSAPETAISQPSVED